MPLVASWEETAKHYERLYLSSAEECLVLESEKLHIFTTLKELFALVQGECPSLLDDDRDGDGTLCLKILDIIDKEE